VVLQKGVIGYRRVSAGYQHCCAAQTLTLRRFQEGYVINATCKVDELAPG